MKNCWANKYSKCEGGISKEHIVSSGIFEQKTIFVQGYDWCKKEKEIGVSNITSKMLCKKHNNGLSKIDQSGINAVRIIESVLPLNAQSLDTTNIEEYIEGFNFERWLLKIAINTSVYSNYHIGFGMSESKKGLPSPYLLAVLFGELNFSHNMGLYFLYPERGVKIKAGMFLIYPIIKDFSIGGFVFHVRGLDFILSLYPGHNPPSLRELGIQNPTGYFDYILDAKPQYRDKSITINNEQDDKYQISFKW